MAVGEMALAEKMAVGAMEAEEAVSGQRAMSVGTAEAHEENTDSSALSRKPARPNLTTNNE